MAAKPILKKPVMNNFLPKAFKHRDKELENIMNEMGTAKIQEPPRPTPLIRKKK